MNLLRNDCRKCALLLLLDNDDNGDDDNDNMMIFEKSNVLNQYFLPGSNV